MGEARIMLNDARETDRSKEGRDGEG